MCFHPAPSPTFPQGPPASSIGYEGLAPGHVGLYQLNVAAPSIAASDSVPLSFTLGGVSGTQKVFLSAGN